MKRIQLTEYCGWSGCLYYTAGQERLPIVFLDGKATVPEADLAACVAAVELAFGDRYVVTRSSPSAQQVDAPRRARPLTAI